MRVSDMLETEELIEICSMGIENDAVLGNESTLKQKLFMLAYLAAGLFLSKYRPIQGCAIAWVNSNRGYEKLFINDNAYIIFHGTAFSNVLMFRRKPSLFSCFCFVNRFSIFIRATSIYLSNKTLDNYPLWLEFYLIYIVLSKYSPTTFFTSGLYDRHTTWQSHIMKSQTGKFVIRQHGVCAVSAIKHKIYCDKMFVLNNKELELMKDNVIENTSCEYEKMEFKSTIEFEKYGEKEGIKIGVITQVNPDRINEWVKAIEKVDFPAWIFLMLHPLDKKSNYKAITSSANVIASKKSKYIDMDILMLENSTIIYDYISSGYRGLILRIDANNTPLDVNLGFIGEYIHITNPDEIDGIVNNWIKQRRNKYV
jgi:hypothetical protein